MSERRATPAPWRRRSLAREYVEALLIAVVFATFARTWTVQAFKIPTGSMEENLKIGDHILVNKFVYGPVATGLERWLLPVRELRRGDIAVFKYPEDPTRDFIKRCVGLPGDVVEIRDKVVFVNGQAVDDAGYTYRTDERVYPRSLFLPEGFRQRDNFGPYSVPAKHYFFLGDNRDESNDSRFWGPVPATHVKGRALMVYWSLDARRTEAPARSGWWGRAAQAAGALPQLVARTRWERSFQLVR